MLVICYQMDHYRWGYHQEKENKTNIFLCCISFEKTQFSSSSWIYDQEKAVWGIQLVHIYLEMQFKGYEGPRPAMGFKDDNQNF